MSHMHAHKHVLMHTHTHTHTQHSDPTCTDPLDCYEEEPQGDVETEVNVTVPEVEFMEDTHPLPLPPVTNSPIKTTAPSNRQDPEEDEEEEEENDPSRVAPVSGRILCRCSCWCMRCFQHFVI